jgi:cytochrome c oxidase cbb3-type subunit III
MTASRWAGAGFLLLIVAGVAPRPLAAAQVSPAIEQGAKLFEGLCAVCHGTAGGGGEAPSLNRFQLDRAPDDEALRALIKTGIPNRMPHMRHLSDDQLQQLGDYVRSLGRTPSAPPDGDPRRGSELYTRLACASCHIVDGQGGSIGPVLTEIGVMRGAEYLRQAIVDPGAALPRGTLSVPGRDLLQFLPVRVVTRDGREVRGIRVNEDSLTIQLRDTNGRFHSFRKPDLQTIRKETGTSLMPSYKDRLTAGELADLVAYLWSLRGSR